MSDDKTIGEELSQEEFLARVRHAGLSEAELALRYGRGGRPAPDALPVEVIQQRLESLVYLVLSMRRSVRAAAEALAWFPAARVEALYLEVAGVCRTSLDLAYHLCVHAPEVLRHLPDEAIHPWVLELLEVYDQKGTQGSIRFMQQAESYALSLRERRSGVRLAELSQVLEAFTAGLAGRRLRLEVEQDAGQRSDQLAYTDTETLFLPPVLSRFDSREDNFRLYKSMIAHLWAQTWFGTWRGWGSADHQARFADPRLGLALFRSLEGLRLDARIAEELPGLWREMDRLGARPPLSQAWQAAAERMREADADAARSWALAEELARSGVPPLEPLCYQGEMHPERVAVVMAARAARERDQLGEALAVIADELGGNLSAAAPEGERPEFRVERESDDDWPGGFAFQLVLGDQPIQPLPETVQLMHSIVQDFGHIPAEYLEAAGQGIYHHRRGVAEEGEAPVAESDTHVYNEWDYGRQGYRKGWCQLRERPIHPQPDRFVEETRHKYRGLLKHLYRTFEALRGEEKLLRREPYGEDPDIDALVEAYADQAQGLEQTDRLFQRRKKLERNVAVLFMVDMSGSTKGWINEVQRESLVLLCESLERLGDRYAIYGFSGYTHMRCELYRVKAFNEPYDQTVHHRISGIRPQDYTRMGVSIRHLTRKLLEVEARTRVLLVLSDGRPDDEDGYRGDYGIEDTRQAVLEARAMGVHPFCITIDDQAQDYLPHLFGPASYTLVEKVAKLPYRVSDIYRRITA
ncbi:MAG: nitric oxide reductase activation protein NorD [Bdellovibrio bacteriovorus]